MSSRSLTTAGFAAGEYTHVAVPRVDRGNAPVFIVHSAGSVDDGFGSKLPTLTKLVKVCSRGSQASDYKGIKCYGNTLGGSYVWGNATALARLDSLYALAGKPKVHLIAISMGAVAAIRWAAANPTKVASIQCVIPAAHPRHLYEQNQGSVVISAPSAVSANSIAVAWGLTFNVVTAAFTSGSTAVTFTVGTMLAAQDGYLAIANTGGTRQTPNTPVPFGTTIAFVDATHGTLSAPATATVTKQIAIAQQLPAALDLATVAAPIAAASIPTRLFYSSVDQYVDPADATALATACGGTATQIDSTYGHVDSTLVEWAANGGTDFSELVTFLVAHGA